MFDFKNFNTVIRQAVAEENQKDQNWKWSVKSISKHTVRIYWEYLEYIGCKKPFFSITHEADLDWIWMRDEDGAPTEAYDCGDKFSSHGTPETMVADAVHHIANRAHNCY